MTVVAWFKAWRAERERKRRVRAERAWRATQDAMRRHIEVHAGLNSVARGSIADAAHDRHVAMHAELLGPPAPLTLLPFPDSRTDAERREDGDA